MKDVGKPPAFFISFFNFIPAVAVEHIKTIKLISLRAGGRTKMILHISNLTSAERIFEKLVGRRFENILGIEQFIKEITMLNMDQLNIQASNVDERELKENGFDYVLDGTFGCNTFKRGDNDFVIYYIIDNAGRGYITEVSWM